MKIAHFDCRFGASGDMLLGAVLDVLEKRGQLGRWRDSMARITSIEADGKIEIRNVKRADVPATKVDFFVGDIHANDVKHGDDASQKKPHRHLRHIRKIFLDEREQGKMSPEAVELSERIFLVLAEAEALAHECDIEKVHFHEVGAYDSIMDVAGFASALTMLGIDEVWSSPVMFGKGKVNTDHGLLDVPTPAVAEIHKARPFPITEDQADGECLTPTGAALLVSSVSRWENLDVAELPETEIGIGAGTRNPEHYANVVRLHVFQM